MLIESGTASDLLIQSPGHAFLGSDLDARMAKPTRQPGIIRKAAPWIPLALILGIGAWGYTVLDHRIDGLDHRIDRVDDRLSKLDDRLRGVENGIAELRVELKYRPRAAALGFRDADIKLVRLAPQSAFRTLIFPSYNLTYTILKISNDRILFRLDGYVGGLTIVDFQFDLPFKIGEVTPIKGIAGPGIPVLYITVLDRIAPNQAVVAIGSVTAPSTKG